MASASPARVLVAPDSFKGTFAATEVALALAEGLAQLGVEVVMRPVADGGEGTLSVILTALDGETCEAACHDALGRPITAHVGLIDDGRTAVVEAAVAVGLPMIAEADRDAEASTSAGVGELIVAAAEIGVERVIVTVGGVASTDGGRGAVDVILAADCSVPMAVLCDVDTVFEDAAAVFGPQKGADAAAVVRLTNRLHDFAATLPRDPRGVARTGAAGGLAGGLWAALDAELVSGAEYVLDLLEFDRALVEADAVVTGEGCFDQQTLHGKVVGEVLKRANLAGIPCYIVAGRSEWDELPGGIAGLVVASTRDELVRAGREIAARKPPTR